MASAPEVTIDVIVHATEDGSKFLDAFEKFFMLPREEFSAENATGYYDNPITVLSARLRKDPARNFLESLLGKMSLSQRNAMVGEITQRVSGSRFHLRLAKQEFLNGVLSFQEQDAIRLKIYTPVYNKKETVEAFRKIFKLVK